MKLATSLLILACELRTWSQDRQTRTPTRSVRPDAFTEWHSARGPAVSDSPQHNTGDQMGPEKNFPYP